MMMWRLLPLPFIGTCKKLCYCQRLLLKASYSRVEITKS